MTLLPRTSLIISLLVCLVYPVQNAAGQSDSIPQFESDVLPILTESCFQCHATDTPMGGLDLRTPPSILRGGTSGPAIIAHSAESSFLHQRVADGSMPPGPGTIAPEQVDTIRRWIDAGGPALESYQPTGTEEVRSISEEDRQFWAFRKLVPVHVPTVRQVGQVRTPIDAFVLSKLGEKGMRFSPDAEPLTLIRRAYFDLIGLPPSPSEVDAFLANPSDAAYQELIDKLLASSHFGERWGRHWLDEAGYVDSIGGDNDAPIVYYGLDKWKYRDYVVRSFNEDKPYDRFLTEQLAGDELVDWRTAETLTPEVKELLEATGFLRVAADDTTQYELNTVDIRYDVLHRTLRTVTSNLLGLTIMCAQCHNHKYDPIPQRDYYRMAAIFMPVYNPNEWLQPEDRLLADVSLTEREKIDEENLHLDRRVQPLKRKLATVHRPYHLRLLEEKLVELPENLRKDLKTAVLTPDKERTAIQKYLMDKLGTLVDVPVEEISVLLSQDEERRATEFELQISHLEESRHSYGRIHAVYDTGPPPSSYLLLRGNYQNPGREVKPGFLEVLTDLDKPQVVEDSPPTNGSSGRRLALARWLTDKHSPAGALSARVRINRVWQHLLGEGIVATSDNFGRNGAPPTHPELLNWLAGQFIAQGWHIKPLIKQIMTSSVYRQASYRAESESVSASAADPWSVDPGNKLLWRMRLRRLESEIIRDAMLETSGKLDLTMGGPPVLLKVQEDGKVVIASEDEVEFAGLVQSEKITVDNPKSRNRRSIYLLARRNYNLSMLSVFDQPVMSTNCTRRNHSAVVLQSLSMLNNEFVLEQAQAFAQRVKEIGGLGPQERIALAFRLALARNPKPEEFTWSMDLLQAQARHFQDSGVSPEEAAQNALVSLCQMLFNSSEFLYVG